jgi:hypothetical protein
MKRREFVTLLGGAVRRSDPGADGAKADMARMR